MSLMPDGDLKCENFITTREGLYMCVGVPIPTDGVPRGEGFYRTLDGDVWVCEYHRFIDLSRGLE